MLPQSSKIHAFTIQWSKPEHLRSNARKSHNYHTTGNEPISNCQFSEIYNLIWPYYTVFPLLNQVDHSPGQTWTMWVTAARYAVCTAAVRYG